MPSKRISRAGPGARAATLHALATEAFRRGNHSRARQHWEQALRLLEGAGDAQLDAASIQSNLGVVAAALGDHAMSRRQHEAALASRLGLLGGDHPDVAESLHNLGVALRSLGEPAAARTAHERALAIWRAALGPEHAMVATALTSLGNLALEEDDAATALALHREALDIRGRSGGPDADVAATLAQIGLALRKLGRPVAARQHLERAVAIRPDLATAQHALAAIAYADGRPEDARRHAEAGLRSETVLLEASPHATRTVLILATTTQSNVPLEHLLPARTHARIWWFAEHGDPSPPLPRFDLVVNAIGEADLSAATTARIGRVVAASGRPLVNPPPRVAATRRDRLPALLDGIDGAVVPLVLRVPSGPAPAGLRHPLVLRPVGSHGGAGLLRVDDDDRGVPGSGEFYASEFYDVRAADGYCRKYRIIFVDRVPYPYHLAISQDWIVHYFSADMAAHPWKLEEERRFLDDPDRVLGPRGTAAIAAIGTRIDLDYCGVDFGLLPDGRVLVFEANPTMLVHPEEQDGPLGHKNAQVGEILTAFDAMLSRRMRR
ncbi:MAG TPA: tetratricopeptide repeat protein [Acetobacteraceae bacterium]|nr:tetratricopeptide repeat protein [Acetobacteraceae bacterium]